MKLLQPDQITELLKTVASLESHQERSVRNCAEIIKILIGHIDTLQKEVEYNNRNNDVYYLSRLGIIEEEEGS